MPGSQRISRNGAKPRQSVEKTDRKVARATGKKRDTPLVQWLGELAEFAD